MQSFFLRELIAMHFQIFIVICMYFFMHVIAFAHKIVVVPAAIFFHLSWLLTKHSASEVGTRNLIRIMSYEVLELFLF